jgi:DNA polymerase-3 subunit epsilon
MLTSLIRPLVFLDLETTTNIVKDARIVQYYFRKFYPSGDIEMIDSYVNPTVPITEAATKVHGLTNEQVSAFPTFKERAAEVLEFIKGCDIVTYNGNSFDIPILYFEFVGAGIDWDYSDVHFIDACNIFKINEPRDLANAYKHYTGKTLVGAHNADNDVDATVQVFVHQMDKYGLSWDMEELALYSNYGQKRADITGKFTVVEGEYVINFGKNKGVKASQCREYLRWMLSSDFPSDARRICEKILNS